MKCSTYLVVLKCIQLYWNVFKRSYQNVVNGIKSCCWAFEKGCNFSWMNNPEQRRKLCKSKWTKGLSFSSWTTRQRRYLYDYQKTFLIVIFREKIFFFPSWKKLVNKGFAIVEQWYLMTSIFSNFFSCLKPENR